jgi:hypothetical protein
MRSASHRRVRLRRARLTVANGRRSPKSQSPDKLGSSSAKQQGTKELIDHDPPTDTENKDQRAVTQTFRAAARQPGTIERWGSWLQAVIAIASVVISVAAFTVAQQALHDQQFLTQSRYASRVAMWYRVPVPAGLHIQKRSPVPLTKLFIIADFRNADTGQTYTQIVRFFQDIPRAQ